MTKTLKLHQLQLPSSICINPIEDKKKKKGERKKLNVSETIKLFINTPKCPLARIQCVILCYLTILYCISLFHDLNFLFSKVKNDLTLNKNT